MFHQKRSVKSAARWTTYHFKGSDTRNTQSAKHAAMHPISISQSHIKK